MSLSKETKPVVDVLVQEVSELSISSQTPDSNKGLQKGLNSRHVSMIALAGIIGPGLISGLGLYIQAGGQAALLIGYAVIGVLAFSCIQAVGEMSSMYPGGGFGEHAKRFCSDSFAAVINLNYYVAWACIVASEYNNLSSTMTFFTNKVPIYGWFLIFWTVFLSFQLLGVSYYGEAEFWLALLKIAGLTAYYIFSLVYILGGVKGTKAFGFQYWKNPGAITHGFKGMATVFIICSSSYVGIEAIAITAAETVNPAKAIPSATRKTFIRIIYVYFFLAFFYGTTVSGADRKLNGNSNTLRSPMTIAIMNAGWSQAGYLVNTFILVTALSAINSSIYIGSRTLLFLANDGIVPKLFAKTNKRGVPINAIVLTNLIGFISLMNLSLGAATAYRYIINLSGVSTFLVWAGISLTHIRFRKAWKQQGKSLDELVYRDRFYPVTSYVGLIGNIFFALVQGWSTIKPFDAGSFVDAYILLPVSAIAYLGLTYWRKSKWVKLGEIDFELGRTFSEKDERQQGRELKEPKKTKNSKKESNISTEGWFWSTRADMVV